MATRHERVIIDLDDRFTSPMARMAASTSVFRRNLEDSRGSVVAFDKSTKDTAPTIDKLSGRLAILGRTAAVLGPGFAPIMASAVPAVAALSTELGFVVAASGTAVLAFKGVGDGLKAVNEYQLKPTQENFEKMQEALKNLGPAAREFVGFLDHIGPKLQTLRQAAQDGLLPGVQDGIESLMTRLPQVRSIISQIASASGDVARSFGEDLASNRWDDFFNFLKNEARPTLIALGQTAANVGHGIAELFVAFAPMSRDFTSGILAASDAFDRWASNLSKTQGFQDFLSYVRETGPEVIRLVGSLGNAVLQIVEAAAPLGGPVLQALTAVVDVIAKIADSPIGTPLLIAVSAMSALSLASNAFAGVMESKVIGTMRMFRADLRTMGQEGIVAWGRTEAGALRYAKASERVRGTLATFGKQAAVIGGLALATSDLGDKMGFANAASGALMGTIAGPWGAAIGGAVGLTMDLAHANDDLDAAIKNVNTAFDTGSIKDQEAALKSLQDQVDKTSAAIHDSLSAGGSRSLGTQLSEGFTTLGHAADVAWNAVSGGTDSLTKAKSDLAFFRADMKDTANATGGLASLFGSALGPGLHQTAHQFELASQSADAFRGSLTQVNALLEKRGTFRAYQASLDAFTEGLKKNGKAFSELTDKGRENNANLDAIISSALKFAENLKGVDRIDFLKRAQQQVRDAAAAMDLPARKTRQLLALFDKLDGTDAKPKVDVQGADKAAGKVKNVKDKALDLNRYKAHPELIAKDLASGRISLVEAALAKLDHQSATVTIKTVRQTVRETVNMGNSLVGSIFGNADGGTIEGPRHPYGDKVLSWLAPGEEVITNRNGEADRYRADRAAGTIPHYASGGTVGLSTSARAADARDRQRAAEAKRREADRKQREDRLDHQITRLRDSMDKTRSTLAELKSSIQGSLKHDPFGNGAAGLLMQLRADRNDAASLGSAVTVLQHKGLNNGLIKELAASGDVNTAQQLAAMTKSQLRQYSTAYTGRNYFVSDVANRAGRVESRTIARLNSEINHLNSQLKHLRTLNKLDQAVERGARRGIADRDRKTAQRRRSKK